MMENPYYNIGEYRKTFKPPVEIISTEKKEEFEEFKKRVLEKNPKTKIVMTHSGCFHADEVLAVVLIRYMKNYEDIVLVRTRNKELFPLSDIIVDVGGIFNSNTLRYDHHMDSFKEVFDKEKIYSKYNFDKVKLSSAGLVHKYHGKEIIKNILESWLSKNEIHQHTAINNDIKEILRSEQVENNIEKLWLMSYEKFICNVDGNDNGVNQYELGLNTDIINENGISNGNGSVDKKIKNCSLIKNYSNTTSYDNRVGRLNPNNINRGNQTSQFNKAMVIAEDEFIYCLGHLALSTLPSEIVIKKCVDNRLNIHSSGEVLYLDQTDGTPWKGTLLELEKDLGLEGKFKFLIGKTKGEGFRIHTIPSSPGSFEFRKGLSKAWRGKEIIDLKQTSGIDDIIFVHNSGFIGGAKSFESALKMVDISLNE